MMQAEVVTDKKNQFDTTQGRYLGAASVFVCSEFVFANGNSCVRGFLLMQMQIYGHIWRTKQWKVSSEKTRGSSTSGMKMDCTVASLASVFRSSWLNNTFKEVLKRRKKKNEKKTPQKARSIQSILFQKPGRKDVLKKKQPTPQLATDRKLLKEELRKMRISLMNHPQLLWIVQIFCRPTEKEN